ncbi:MAG: hypothetical protein R3253_16040, partial [Longimicrobiales bacterium]|nr:hypothetical protein [Longimicrobiales bacterium]
MSTTPDEEKQTPEEPGTGEGGSHTGEGASAGDHGPSATRDGASASAAGSADATGSDAKKPRPSWSVRAAKVFLIAACVVAASAAMAGFGSRWGLWHFRTGFTVLRWAVYGALGVTALTLPVLWLTRPGKTTRDGFLLALLALLVAAPVFVIPLGWRLRAGDVPPIHDITTDTNDPPSFQAILPLRADAPNPPEYQGADVAGQQQEAYPDIRPTILDVPMGRAYE